MSRRDSDVLPIFCPDVLNYRHRPVATTVSRQLVAGELIDAHTHDDHQLVYASRGVLAVATPTGHWIAPADRAIWVPAGTPHEHRAFGATDFHTVGIHRSEDPLGLHRPAVLDASPLLRELIVTYTGERDRHTDANRRMRAVLIDQLRHSPSQAIHLPAPRDPRLAAACDLLRANPSDQRTLGELGAAVGASGRTLSRRFRADLGMTFPQWRTQLRLHHALVLLTENTPVTEVAHACGWSTPSAFIDVFRRTFGSTPGTQ